jgi:hypothetical protein
MVRLALLISLALISSVLPGSPLTSPSVGQTPLTVGADISLRTDYIWRGVIRRNGWVLQPSAFVSLGAGQTQITAGWWTHIELGSPDSDDPASVGLGRAWFGENDVWLEVSSTIGPVGVSGGFIRYLFAREHAFPDARLFDTSELYGRIWVNTGPFVSEVSLWYDLDAVDGAYVETGVDYRVPTLPSRSPILSLHLSAHAGWSLGQEVNPWTPGTMTPQRGYFADEGLTHIDLGVRLMIGEASSYVTVEGHALLGVDSPEDFPDSAEATRRGSTAWWFGLTVSPSSVVAVF